MDKCRRTSASFLFMFIILSPQVLSVVVGDGAQDSAQNMQEKPSLIKTVEDTISMLKKSHKSSWDKIKTIIHDIQLRFFPPNLDFRGAGEGSTKNENGGGGTTERMKMAAQKSFGTSKMTAEKSAESVANAVGETMHKTKETVKKSLSDHDEEPHDEL